MFSCSIIGECDGAQKTLRNQLTGVEYLISGQYSKCAGLSWCPNFPFGGRHELNVVLSPKTTTEFTVIKVRHSDNLDGL